MPQKLTGTSPCWKLLLEKKAERKSLDFLVFYFGASEVQQSLGQRGSHMDRESDKPAKVAQR